VLQIPHLALSDARIIAVYAIFSASYLAGNLTITGSVANIIVVETARPQVSISFRDYFRAGLPITAGTLTCGGLWLRLVR
jgi:Na+/H+ antiporter NhaD/arsenite permease-like protein